MSGGEATLRVLDLTSGVAGPYATRLLAGYGATVTKVERPGAGDWGRRLPPLKDGCSGPEASAFFAFLNAGKRSVTLDLKQAGGRALLNRLIARSDLVVESVRPSLKRRFGVDAATLAAANPGVASVSITNFGESGPNRDRAASELTLQAIGGMLARNGTIAGGPLKLWGHQAQLIAGANAFTAAMAALLASRRDGNAHHADVSIHESVLQFLHSTLLKWQFEGVELGREAVATVANGVYPCADGYAGIVVAGSGTAWRRIPELMEEPRLTDERFRTLGGRARNADEVEALMLPWIIGHRKEDIYHLGQAQSIPFASVRTAPDIFGSQQLAERGYFSEIEHPSLGRLRLPGPPFRLESLSWRALPSPMLGEHNRPVLCDELGLDGTELNTLQEVGVV